MCPRPYLREESNMSYSFAAKTLPPSEHAGIRRKLAQVRMQLACAEDLFNCATDEAMVDTSIYQLKSLQVYYSFLMRQLRLEEGDEPEEEVPLPPLDALEVPGEMPAPAVPEGEGMVETMG